MSFGGCVVFLCYLLCIYCGDVIGQNAIGEMVNTNIKSINYRLPNNTKPEHYDLTLNTRVDQNDFNFSGRVVIKLRALEESPNITIHARQLKIEAIKLVTISGAPINLNPYTYDNITEFLVIPSQSKLQRDAQYILFVDYSGVLRAGGHGIYRSSYTNSKGELKQVQMINSKLFSIQNSFPFIKSFLCIKL